MAVMLENKNLENFLNFFSRTLKLCSYPTYYSLAKFTSSHLKVESRCLITNTENVSSIRLQHSSTNLTLSWRRSLSLHNRELCHERVNNKAYYILCGTKRKPTWHLKPFPKKEQIVFCNILQSKITIHYQKYYHASP